MLNIEERKELFYYAQRAKKNDLALNFFNSFTISCLPKTIIILHINIAC